ncbi:THO complex subunit 1 isoform X1 [Natator depressus]|uniref:THO complex subunit 1 isoform X1 n=1 Tax=Natator depressus TaxID=27790 RepID=UPI003EB9DDBE
MSPPLFSLPEARLRFTNSTRDALTNRTIKPLLNAFNQIPGSENEKKCTLDQSFRVVLEEEIINQASCENVLAIISLAINGVTDGICTASTPFVLLGDVLDCLPLDQCDKIFTFVEKNVTTWKSNTFYSAGKNYLLRMCNDLLRRLSKSQNTVFCGRIQLFLARLFPLSEKSGLNLQSQFNLENVTVFNTNEQESTLGQKHIEERDEGMEVEEGEMGDDEAPTSCSIPIDYNLYRKFWSLQDYFRNPVQCYEKISWKTFLKYSEEVLAVFKSYKLDDTQASRKKLEELKTGGEHVYFAKFLTSEKLMDLQLSDSNFRRHILLQYLILFQYLKGQVKFKSSNYVLTDEQSLWIEDTTKLVYQLLSENPPDGERFSKMVEHILNTEENWNTWKNEGCPSFVKERPSDSKPSRLVRKRPAPEDFLGKGPNKKILMGNEELTRLWNLCPDNMEACKSETREYMPTLEEFFEEAIEQADPENMVENEYKAVNNSNYGWRALRLLARRSPHFFQPTNQQFKSLPEYLENMVIKLAKELPPPSEEIKTGEDEDEEDNDALLKENNETACVSMITGSSPSQRLVKIRKKKKCTRDEMFSELMLSSHTDRAQTNAWRQIMSDCRKAQNDQEERWRAEESKWRAEERAEARMWRQRDGRRQDSMLRLLEDQTSMLQCMVELQQRQLEHRLPLQPLCNQPPSSPSSIASTPRRPRTRWGGHRPTSHSTTEDCPQKRRLSFNKF